MAARGRPPGGQTKAWKDAIWREVCEEYEKEDGTRERKLRAIARRVVNDAMDGKMDAIREVGDRIDGKAQQSVDVTLHDGFAGFIRTMAERSGSDMGEVENEPSPVRH